LSSRSDIRSLLAGRLAGSVGLAFSLYLLGAPLLAWGASSDDPPPVTAESAPAATPSPPTVPAAATPATAAAAPAADTGPRTEGVIPGVLFGPKVTATLLFPPNVMVGLDVKVIGYIGASFEYGVFPSSQTVDAYNLKVKTWSAGLRAYPFQGAFFVGLVLGNYDLTATQQVGIGQTETLHVTSMYLGPQIGWKWAFDFGLFLGLNLGYGFSLDYQSTLVQPPLANGDLQTAKENADKYLKTGVPIFTLLELGWLF